MALKYVIVVAVSALMAAGITAYEARERRKRGFEAAPGAYIARAAAIATGLTALGAGAVWIASGGSGVDAAGSEAESVIAASVAGSVAGSAHPSASGPASVAGSEVAAPSVSSAASVASAYLRGLRVEPGMRAAVDATRAI